MPILPLYHSYHVTSAALPLDPRNNHTDSTTCPPRKEYTQCLAPQPSLHDESTALTVWQPPPERDWQPIIENLTWAFNVSSMLGAIFLFHIPTIRHMPSQIKQEANKPSQGRDKTFMVFESVGVLSSVSSLTSLAIRSITANPMLNMMANSLDYLSNICGNILLPYTAENGINDGEKITARISNIHDKHRVLSASLAQSSNPAFTFLAHIKIEEHFAPEVAKGTYLSIVRALNVGAAVTGASGIYALTNIASLYLATQSSTKSKPSESEQAKSTTEQNLQKMKILMGAIAEISVSEIRLLLTELGLGDYLAWQCRGARYTDDQEMRFFQTLLLMNAHHEEGLLSVSQLNNGLTAIELIYNNKDWHYLFTAHELQNDQVTNLCEFLELLDQERKKDKGWCRNSRGFSVLGWGNNNVYRLIILPLVSLHWLHIENLIISESH